MSTIIVESYSDILSKKQKHEILAKRYKINCGEILFSSRTTFVQLAQTPQDMGFEVLEHLQTVPCLRRQVTICLVQSKML